MHMDTEAVYFFNEYKLTKTMEDKVITLIARVQNVPTNEVELDTEIGDLDEWDSLHNVEILSQLEKEFDVKITPDMVMDMEDVSDIVGLIEDLVE